MGRFHETLTCFQSHLKPRASVHFCVGFWPVRGILAHSTLMSSSLPIQATRLPHRLSPAIRGPYHFRALLGLLLSALTTNAQTLSLHDAVRTLTTLTNTTVTLSGRAELRITGTGNPISGSVIDLTSPDAWLLMTSIAPSQVASTFLSRVRVNGAIAVRDWNVRVVQYAEGTVVIPQGPEFSPLQLFNSRFFTGPSRRLNSFVEYDEASLGSMASTLGSFKLKRGYMATFAEQENGAGTSRCYVAQDGDLEVGLLPATFQTNTHYIRIFPWRWAAKKGIAGNIESDLNVSWVYNWNLDRNSTLDWEYIPIRQARYWPSLDQDWKARGSTQLLGYNEPDRPDQANMAVGDAIWSWPDLLGPGLRVGAPAVSDGGLAWLYDFIEQADANGLRVDFVPVHYYRCYGNPADPAGTASQFYNFLKGIYDMVKRPLWVTEWNNGANWTQCADPTFAQQEAAVQAMIDMLESTPFVERYALYNWVEDVRRVKWDDGSLTDAGVRYRDKASSLAYRQEMGDAGTGSSARYSFDGNTHDEWGNGQDAMRVGAPAFTVGKYGQSIALNGTTDYLQLSPRLGDSTDWSFTGWVNWNGGGNWQRIFDFGDDTSHHLFLTPRSGSSTLRFTIVDGGSEQQLNAPALIPGVWTHLAVTLAGTTGKLYVNGLPVATNSAMTINPVDVGTKFNYLGRSRFAADPLFGGRFDDFRFVSSAFTDAQVAAVFSTPPPQFRTETIYKPDALVPQPYSATLAGDAIGTGPLTFTKMDGPAWLTIGPNGTLSGTPGMVDGGINNFLVRVTDANGSLHTATLLITVPTVTMAIASSADDAEQSAGGMVTLNSTDLEIVRDDGTSSGDQIIGLRFADLSVPRGAVITTATIQFTADEAQTEVTALNIFAQASDDAGLFTTAVNSVGSRPLTSLSVPWQPAAWTTGQSNATQRTPNLAALLQEVTSRPGWSGGNAVVFVLSGTGHRTADSFDKSDGFPPRLTVNYRSPTPVYTVNSAVNGSPNDAEQSSAGVVTLNSSDLELVNDGAQGDQVVGLRFEKLAVPAGAVIANATIQFTANETQTDPTALTIRAQAADNAPAFTNTANNLDRLATSASIAWSPAAWTTADERGPLQRTPDLSAIVSELIARPGWSNGNAMVFLITGSGHRTVDAADEIGGSPATLMLSYSPEIPVGTYARWASVRTNVNSPMADLDGDGYNNFFEYALGLDPAVPTHGATLPAVNATSFEFTYLRPAGVTDTTYEVEWADRLEAAPWNGTGVTQQIIADDGTNRLIRAVVPKGSSGRRFLRLKVAR
jgi:hypothetical protein